MARSGIYVNGKEIVARYIGDKCVWKNRRVAYTMQLATWSFGSDDRSVTGYVYTARSNVPIQRFENIQIKLAGIIYSVNSLSLSYKGSSTPIFVIEFQNRSDASSFESRYWGNDRNIEILI